MRVPEGEGEKKRIETEFIKMMARRLNQKQKRYPKYGSTVSPKQDEPKQTYTKTYYN